MRYTRHFMLRCKCGLGRLHRIEKIAVASFVFTSAKLIVNWLPDSVEKR